MGNPVRYGDRLCRLATSVFLSFQNAPTIRLPLDFMGVRKLPLMQQPYLFKDIPSSVQNDGEEDAEAQLLCSQIRQLVLNYRDLHYEVMSFRSASTLKALVYLLTHSFIGYKGVCFLRSCI